MSQFYLDTDSVYRCSLFSDLSWVEHGFGTRRSPDWLAGRPLSTLRQVHSDTVLVADGNGADPREGDGLVTGRPDQLVGIRTADCLPILYIDTRRRIVAAVHAGWRGSVADIAAKAVERMREAYGCDPADLSVAIGPAIGPCCFEVGPEVASNFRDIFPERSDLDSRTRIDLVEVNRRCLGQAGLEQRQIASANLCTRCEVALFESYRRDGSASGRMVSAIGIRQN